MATAGRTVAVAEGRLFPAALVAVTKHSYRLPLVKPVTTSGDAGPLALNPPTLHVAVKLVIGEPPSEPAVKLIVAKPLPGVALTPVGASGTVAGATGVTLTLADGALGPTALVAVTEHEYVVPLVNPVTVSGDDAPLALKPPELQVAV